MQLATVPKNDQSILSLHQFWMYFIVMNSFWITQAITWSIQDPICFDLLGDYIWILKVITLDLEVLIFHKL